MKCCFCKRDIFGTIELAQHIADAGDTQHQRGKTWAAKYLKRKGASPRRSK